MSTVSGMDAFNVQMRIFGENDAARWLEMVFRAFPDFSDLDLQSEMEPVVMVHGKRYVLPRTLDHNEIVHVVEALYPNGWAFLQREQGGLNTAYSLQIADADRSGLPPRVRLRFNAVLCRDPINPSAKSAGVQVTLRAISETPPDWRKFDIPEDILENFFFPDGIVLVTGPTGSGKSTLMAAMFGRALEDPRFADHKIITAEAPIEFVFRHPRVSQSEVPRHIQTFDRAIEEAMRRRPNVIMVGELRDRATIIAALTAAMTGHYVLGTLHATGVANAVSRAVKSFPRDEAESLANDLVDSLRLVLSQRLLPAPDGTLQAVREWMIFTEAMRLQLLKTPFDRLTPTIAEMVKTHGHPFAQDARHWHQKGRLTDHALQWLLSSYG
jgi:defect-in-organelle-trafficking protein DotB